MLSAVLDTNVLASGSLASSAIPRHIINLWQGGYFKLYISDFIINELKEVFEKPFFKTLISKKDIEDYIELLETDAIFVQLEVKIKNVATHPEDDSILATAINAKSDYLVTGDQPLQNLKKFNGIEIVSPRAFSEIIDQKKAV